MLSNTTLRPQSSYQICSSSNNLLYTTRLLTYLSKPSSTLVLWCIHLIWCMRTGSEFSPSPHKHIRQDWTGPSQVDGGSHPEKAPSAAGSRRCSHMCCIDFHQPTIITWLPMSKRRSGLLFEHPSLTRLSTTQVTPGNFSFRCATTEDSFVL